MIYCSSEQIAKISSSADIVPCKELLIKEMEQRVGKVEFGRPIALATLLGPRFKNINFKNAIACSGTLAQLKKMVVELKGEVATSSSPAEEEECASYSASFWSHQRASAHGDQKKSIDDEVAVYLKQGVSPLKSDPLQVWEDMKSLPKLFLI